MEKRNTKQKQVLIKYLKENSNKHITIQDIYQELKNNIGLTTIYRIINALTVEGCVIKIPLENGQGFCYQYNIKTIECNKHYHLICENCGDLVHFQTEKIKEIVNEASSKEDFAINKEKIVFYGKCNKCQNGRKNEEK